MAMIVGTTWQKRLAPGEAAGGVAETARTTVTFDADGSFRFVQTDTRAQADRAAAATSRHLLHD